MNPQLKQSGFGLLEVLITLVLTAIGVLGMVAMQSKSIQYTQQSINRNTAATLASDLMETLRGNRDDIYDAQAKLRSDSPYFKKAGADFAAAEEDCSNLDNECPKAQLQAWKNRAQQQLPGVTDAFIKKEFHICISQAASGCAATGSAIEIRVAWLGRTEECEPNASGEPVCSYILRAEI